MMARLIQTACAVTLAATTCAFAAPPLFDDVSVHDPDVIKVGDMYYVFGSHLAVAKSPDLLRWTKVADGVRAGNAVIPNVTTEMAEALAWGESDTFWAGCVWRLPDGRFVFYYCACRGDAPRSALGMAIADDIEGPYQDAGILLRSGMTDELSPDGKPFDATVHPNAIDPHVFADAHGKPWMVYGSYSGGIFILGLDPETGRPLPRQGYGKRILGGNHSRIEAPWILHDPDAGYYYLFLSFGGLGAEGGYQIRVARSVNPDGPYLDPLGNDLIDAKGRQGTFFDDASIEPFGAKLIGNFEFAGGDNAWGYVSPGHNSAYRDPETGETLLVFHTRFPGRGQTHEVRVHRLLINDRDWPVIAPQRYDGTPLKEGELTAADVAGDYALIEHGRAITADITSAQTIHLRADGTIDGADKSGRWTLTGERDIDIAIDGHTYHGVTLEQWDASQGRDVRTFTALSDDGLAIWGSGISVPQ